MNKVSALALTKEGTFLGHIEKIDFSITRQRTPIYIMGASEPVSFTRGDRRIAGTLKLSNRYEFMTNVTYAYPSHDDQIPPFTVEIEHETGTIKLGAVEILNEGRGVSLDDGDNESEFSFVAAYVENPPPNAVQVKLTPDGINIHEILQ